MRGGRAGIVVVLVAAALAGCGGGERGLTNGERQALLAQIRAARASAAAGDVGGTETAIRKFRVSVARLQRSGALTDAQARTLRLGAVRVLARVKTDAAPPPQPTQTTPAPAPTQTTPAEPPGKAKKKHEEQKGKKPKGKKH